MQSLRFSSFPTVNPSFQKHRKSIDHSRFTLNLSLCSATNTPIWASLPTPPMSGSPPPDPLKDPAQLAGRRRKRSDSPQTTTAPATSGALPAIIEPPTSRYGDQPTFEQRREQSIMQLAPQPVPYLPPLTYGPGSGAPMTQYSSADVSSFRQQISPRSTRKTKAHVASACINCKKKHLRCDSSRPCRRCVQSGKEDTCKDVEHKKRGRPPLKPEDPTLVGRRIPGPTHFSAVSDPISGRYGGDPRGHAPSNYPPILPNAPQPLYGPGHHRTSSRSSYYGGFQPPYAPPSVAPSLHTVTATGFTYLSRPQSTPSTLATQPQSTYVGQPSYIGQGISRQVQPYSSYPFQPADVPPTTQGFYSTPLFPRESVSSPTQTESQYGHNLQLPPIRPAQPGAIDPSISQQRFVREPTPAQDERRRQPSGERDPKRPKMDIQGILGPKYD